MVGGALALPLATAKVVVPFQTVFTTVFKPVILLFNNTANALIRAMGIEPKEEISGARSAEELSSLVRRSALEGMLDDDHATLLGRTLRFSERSAADVLTPRVRMATVTPADTAQRVVELALATGFSRFPVIGDSVDDIVGVVHLKQAFAVDLDERAARPVAEFMIEPLRVPETMGIDTLLGLLGGLAAQIGQYVERRRAEELAIELARTKDEFLAMVTHELRNPLAAITGTAGLLEDEWEDLHADERHLFLRIKVATGERRNGQVIPLRALARIAHASSARER